MKTRSTLCTIAAALALAASAPAFSQASASMTPQQTKMAECSKQNKGKKGDDFKAAQKACLSGETATATTAKPMTQQEKMTACAKQNKGKKGDDYKAAQKACLST